MVFVRCNEIVFGVLGGEGRYEVYVRIEGVVIFMNFYEGFYVMAVFSRFTGGDYERKCTGIFQENSLRE